MRLDSTIESALGVPLYYQMSSHVYFSHLNMLHSGFCLKQMKEVYGVVHAVGLPCSERQSLQDNDL
jgi:hypothetical protein